MVDGNGRVSSASARTDQYWERLQSTVVGDARRRRALDRSRLFEEKAERFDRCRPGYPEAVIDRLLGPEPSGLEQPATVTALLEELLGIA